MSDLEKLVAIRARCVELLELASKRSEGKWVGEGFHVWRDTNYICNADGNPDAPFNIAYIASCAGPAEAGWRVTIAAIDFILNVGAGEATMTKLTLTKSILAAWEGQV